MKNCLLTLLLCCFAGMVAQAQSTVTGTVYDEDSEPVAGAVVKESNSNAGTVTDADGNFTLVLDQEPPFDLVISFIGFEDQTVTVNKSSQHNIKVNMTGDFNIMQEIVISASRTPERVFESPVTIERMNTRDIQQTSSATFYDGIENLKGIDVNTNSLTFKSVNARGFATFANTRFVQLVDGIDNSSPALNFVLGNLLGMNELDVESVEILPGASSALYGANAFNGILFMNSKNPFDYQGVSAYAKAGFTEADNAGNNGFFDMGLRLAHAFSDKIAIKGSGSILGGTEWFASNLEDFDNPGFTRMNPDYNGLNTYGDEVATTLDLGPLGKHRVSRTGYEASDVMDFNTKSLKGDVAIHVRPAGNDFEIIGNYKRGGGNTVYQGANHYAIKDFIMNQYKLELKNNNFFLRGYLTSEDAGDSYDTRFAAINLNNKWKSNTQWFTEYGMAFGGAMQGLIPGISPGNQTASHAFARSVADKGRLHPGSNAFRKALGQINSDPNLLTGSKFVDNSRLYHVDGNYNFTSLIGWLDDFQIGGSWRQYGLNSDGTIFTDDPGTPITYNEFGAYTQLIKRFANDKLKFTGSLRYDKSELFDGNISPRAALVFSPDEDKKHNIRTSFQTGFRNPTTQDLFIGLDVGNAILVGSAPDNLNRYTTRPIANSTAAQQLGLPASQTLNGSLAYSNAFTLSSLLAFAASANPGPPNPGLLEVSNVDLVQPEEVKSFELGYRGAMGNNTFLDIAGYYNIYNDFISSKTVVVPNYGKVDFSDVFGQTPVALIALANEDFTPFQVYTNSTADINSYGAVIGLDTKIFGDFDFGANFTWADFDFDQASDPDFEPSFNTPEHKVKAYFGHDEVFKDIGFMVNWRWNDDYFWQSTFADGKVDSKSIFDAQLSYSIPDTHATLKFGGANIFGTNYFSAPGAGQVGSQFFVGLTVDPF